jgi:hypothetical protein
VLPEQCRENLLELRRVADTNETQNGYELEAPMNLVERLRNTQLRYEDTLCARETVSSETEVLLTNEPYELCTYCDMLGL